MSLVPPAIPTNVVLGDIVVLETGEKTVDVSWNALDAIYQVDSYEVEVYDTLSSATLNVYVSELTTEVHQKHSILFA